MNTTTTTLNILKATAQATWLISTTLIILLLINAIAYFVTVIGGFWPIAILSLYGTYNTTKLALDMLNDIITEAVEL